MTTFGIIFFIILFGGLIILIHRYNLDIESSVLGSMSASLIILVMFGIMGSIDLKYEKSKTFGITYINSLALRSSISGDFFLGTGTIDEENYYYFMTNNPLGYRISKIEITDRVYVREDGDKKPFIEFTKYEITKINWFGRIFFKKSLYRKEGETIIHVPKNTIIKTYNVDIRNL